jgi:hypothetical protein
VTASSSALAFFRSEVSKNLGDPARRLVLSFGCFWHLTLKPTRYKTRLCDFPSARHFGQETEASGERL